MPPPNITSRDRDQAEQLYARIVKAEQFNYDKVDHQPLVNDFLRLPKTPQEQATHMLRSGEPSPLVVDFLMEQMYLGEVQRLDAEDWLFRVELFRRFYINLDEGVKNRTSEDWKSYLGLTESQGSAHPGRAQTQRPRTEKFTYEPADEADCLNKVGQFSPPIKDLIVQLCLVRETTEVICHLVSRQPDSGVLRNCLLDELLYPIELVRRCLLQLESEWMVQHTRTYFQPSYDAKAEYLRREMRAGLKRAPEVFASGPAETFHFNPEENGMFRQYGRLPGKLQNQMTERLLACDCTDAVTRWLLDQPDRGAWQHATSRELLRLVEYQRRYLHYGLGDPLRGYLRSTRNRANRDDWASQADLEATAERHAELLLDIIEVQKPLRREFLRQLREGGVVEKEALRWSRQLQESVAPGAVAIEFGTTNEPAIRERPRRRKEHPNPRFRSMKGDGMMRTLGKLSPYLLEEAIRLLAHGVKATVVARFILSHEDLGNFPRLAQNTLRQYLQFLATKVSTEATPSRDRKRLIHQVAQQIQKQQARRQTVLLARRTAALANGDGGAAIVIRDVESLLSIKQRLAALFVVDSKQLLADLLALQRKGS